MSAVATETICCGETSMYSTSAGSARIGSPPLRHRTGPMSLLPFGSISAFAWAIVLCSSCVASRRSTSAVTTPSFTRRYGVWMKPNSFRVAKLPSEPIRPMFGPSGVSIGHMRP